MKILVTGGAGYIGSHVNKELNRLGYETVIFDNLENGHREFVKWGKLEVGDLRNKEDLRKVFEKYKIDAVMHFAAYAYVGESVEEPKKYYENNVMGSLNLLETMLDFNVNKIVFSSTCAVYGNPEYVPIDEKHPKNPINPYGKSKLTVEHILEDFDKAYGIKFVSLRYFNAAGADPELEVGEWHDPEPHLIPNVLAAVADKENFVRVYGTDYDTPDGTCIRDFIHVMDLAEAHVKALDFLFNENRSEVFNLGTGKGHSVLEVIKVVEKVTGKRVEYREFPRRPGDPPVLIADPSRAEKILGWKARFCMEDIVSTAWGWYRTL